MVLNIFETTEYFQFYMIFSKQSRTIIICVYFKQRNISRKITYKIFYILVNTYKYDRIKENHHASYWNSNIIFRSVDFYKYSQS